MIGTPIIGVIAFNGSTSTFDGNTDISAHSNPTIAPDKIVAGRITVWFEVPIIILAMCGTTSPINPIGPQYAVTIAVSSPENKRIAFLVRVILSPILSA